MSKRRTVYIVTGETGEYSDHSMWYVSAYDDEGEANDVATALNAKLSELRLSYTGVHVSGDERTQAIEAMKAVDPEISVDYTGSNYGVVAVPFDVVNRSLLTMPASQR